MGDVSQSFMGSVWGGGRSVCVCSSPSFGSALLLFTCLVLGLEPVGSTAGPCRKGFHLTIESTWGVNQLPVKQLGLAAAWSLSQGEQQGEADGAT